MNPDLKEITSLLKDKLLVYMEKHEIELDNNYKFKCPAHDDQNPSASVNPATDYTTWKCFVCGAGGSIYEMFEAIEKIPVKDGNFLFATRKLMEEFDDLKDIPRGQKARPEDIVIINIKRINAFILDLLQYGSQPEKNRHTQARDWKDETAKELGIGSIAYVTLRNKILEKFNIDIEQDGPYKRFYMFPLFGIDRLTFTLFDVFNNPIAFSTRDMNWTKDSKYGKYTNSKNVDGIFKKEKQIYNLAKAKEAIKKEGFLYLFEGQANVVTAWDRGLKNVGAFCGTAITEEQFKTLKRAEVSRIVICMDSDQAGVLACKKHLDELHYLKNGIMTEIVSVPAGLTKEESDPDFYIKKHGIDAFKKLERKSAFDWLLENYPSNKPKDEIVKEMIPHIAFTESNIGWQEKINALALVTGFETEYIKEDVRNFRDRKEQQIISERSRIIRDLYSETKDGGQNIKEQLYAAIGKIERIENSKSGAIVNLEDHLTEIKSIFHEWKSYDPESGLTGWDTGYDSFNKVFDGMPKHEAFIGLAALPHMGKSAMLLNLIVNMLNLVDEGVNKDLMIYLMTIDDAARPVLSRLVGIITEIEMREIKKASTQPQLVQRQIYAGIEKIQKWVQDGRLYIADYSKTNDLNQGIRMMKTLRSKYPDRNSLMFLDNFHKLSSISDAKERHKYVELSSKIQENTVMEQFTCVSTLEFNKTSFGRKRPREADIGESISMNYDAQGLILGHCETIANPDNPQFFWIDDKAKNPIKLPILELNIVKNKINTEKRTLYYCFNPNNTKIKEIHDIHRFQEEQTKLAEQLGL